MYTQMHSIIKIQLQSNNACPCSGPIDLDHLCDFYISGLSYNIYVYIYIYVLRFGPM